MTVVRFSDYDRTLWGFANKLLKENLELARRHYGSLNDEALRVAIMTDYLDGKYPEASSLKNSLEVDTFMNNPNTVVYADTAIDVSSSAFLEKTLGVKPKQTSKDTDMENIQSKRSDRLVEHSSSTSTWASWHLFPYTKPQCPVARCQENGCFRQNVLRTGSLV